MTRKKITYEKYKLKLKRQKSIRIKKSKTKKQLVVGGEVRIIEGKKNLNTSMC